MALRDDPKRLVLENRAVLERWKRAKLCCDPERKWIWWDYTIQMEGNRLSIRVVYPQDYPNSPPEIIILDRLPSGTPHLLQGGARTPLPGIRMCWFYPSETQRSRNMWNPSVDTAAVALGAAHRWFLAFLVWMTTCQWPVPESG